MDRLQEVAASMDMTAGELMALVDELRQDEMEDHRQVAAQVVAEAELLLRRVKTVWGNQRPVEAHRRVLACEDLSGREKVTMLGYLDAVRLGVDVLEVVDAKTARKYRRIAEELGLDRQLRALGRPRA